MRYVSKSHTKEYRCLFTSFVSCYCLPVKLWLQGLTLKFWWDCGAGPVSKIRLLGDYHHPTRIAFIEFNNAESARAALNCSGALLGMPFGLLFSTWGLRWKEHARACNRQVAVIGGSCMWGRFYTTALHFGIWNSGLHVICNTQHCDCRHISLKFWTPKILWRYAGSTPVRVSPSKTPVRPDPRHDDTPVPRRSVCWFLCILRQQTIPWNESEQS